MVVLLQEVNRKVQAAALAGRLFFRCPDARATFKRAKRAANAHKKGSQPVKAASLVVLTCRCREEESQ